MVEVLSCLQATPDLEISSILLISSYCKLLHNDLQVLEGIIHYVYDRLAHPELQFACVELFRSICENCGKSIVQNAQLTGFASLRSSP